MIMETRTVAIDVLPLYIGMALFFYKYEEFPWFSPDESHLKSIIFMHSLPPHRQLGFSQPPPLPISFMPVLALLKR